MLRQNKKKRRKKEQFYGQLEQTYEWGLKRNVACIIGNLNTKVEKEKVFRDVIGKERLPYEIVKSMIFKRW